MVLLLGSHEWNIDIAYQRLCVCGKITHVGGRGADVRGREGSRKGRNRGVGLGLLSWDNR